MRVALADAFFLAGGFGLTFMEGLTVPTFGVAAFADLVSRPCAAAKLFCKLVSMTVLSRFTRERSSTCACRSSFTFAMEAS